MNWGVLARQKPPGTLLFYRSDKHSVDIEGVEHESFH
jgi:hypothetical protein